MTSTQATTGGNGNNERAPNVRPAGLYRIKFAHDVSHEGLRVLMTKVADRFWHVGPKTYVINERQLAELDREGISYEILRVPGSSPSA